MCFGGEKTPGEFIFMKAIIVLKAVSMAKLDFDRINSE